MAPAEECIACLLTGDNKDGAVVLEGDRLCVLRVMVFEMELRSRSEAYEEQ